MTKAPLPPSAVVWLQEGPAGRARCHCHHPELKQSLLGLGCALTPCHVSQPHLLGLVDEVIRLVPVSQEVRGLLVVHPDVVIGEQPRKEVVYFPGHIQNVVNAAEKEN